MIGFFVASAVAASLTIPQTSYDRCKNKKEFGACYELADLYQQVSSKKDNALGEEYVIYGCGLELKKKCSLAVANERRKLFMKAKRNFDDEKEKALRALPKEKSKDELACEQGDGKACDSAGNHWLYMATPATDPAKAKVYFEKACALGDKDGCNTVDLMRKGIIKVFNVDM